MYVNVCVRVCVHTFYIEDLEPEKLPKISSGDAEMILKWAKH